MTDTGSFIEATALLLVLLNPFLVVVYLVELMRSMTAMHFATTLLKAGVITTTIFAAFAILGDFIFTRIFMAQPASFQIFGGLVFLAIGGQFVFRGNAAIESLRGDSPNVAGAIAMPILVGPGTISASVVIGKRLDAAPAVAAVALATFASLGVMVILKLIHDRVATRNEALVQRYFDVTGRITALFIGTIAVQMIMTGLGWWLRHWGVITTAVAS
ncbi:MAG: MarC family protein [Planctomycetota bacterium]|jgi:multiple antibiotic resistance protein|nr:MarC family protein [Planctomycetota bacterium]